MFQIQAHNQCPQPSTNNSFPPTTPNCLFERYYFPLIWGTHPAVFRAYFCSLGSLLGRTCGNVVPMINTRLKGSALSAELSLQPKWRTFLKLQLYTSFQFRVMCSKIPQHTHLYTREIDIYICTQSYRHVHSYTDSYVCILICVCMHIHR